MTKYDSLELARIIGEPKDPRRPYPAIVEALCELDSAAPQDYTYAFDVLHDTDKIYTTVASGVTQENVTPETPTILNFVDLATPEYYVKITDLANAKEAVLARKKKTINRALNMEENRIIIALLEAATTASGKTVHDLDSGYTGFTYKNLIDMIDDIIDYSENYVLVAGTAIDKDIKLWDWTHNKYHSTVQAFQDLGITTYRINQPLSRDGGGATTILTSTLAYLAGVQTEIGKPLLFVRKRLSEMERIGGIISESGDRSERLVFISPNPIQVTSTRYLAVGMIGYEQVASATINPYALVKFSRS